MCDKTTYENASTDDQWLQNRCAMIQPTSERLQQHVFSKSLWLHIQNIQHTSYQQQTTTVKTYFNL